MGAIFMPTIVNYIQFTNSKDFENLYRESVPILKHWYPNIQDFYSKYIRPCIENKTIILLYDNKKIIGYFLYSIKKRILTIHFYYITPKNKSRRHGRYFREKLYESLQNDFDIIQTAINKTNFPSINATKKFLQKLNLEHKITTVDNPIYICKQFFFEIRKKPLDKL